MDAALADLTSRLEKAYGDKLVSVVLYGSAASGDHQSAFSDLNVLCVLNRVTCAELERAEKVFRWWRNRGNPAPLLISEEEVRTSTDCFAIEFHDMQERRRVLFGKDVIADLAIDRSFYRAEVERELRTNLLRLRQRGGGLLSDGSALVRLLGESVSTFLILARHALLLGGFPVEAKKREVARQLGAAGVEAAPFDKLLDLRDGNASELEVSPRPLFDEYLTQIEKLISFVDRLDK